MEIAAQFPNLMPWTMALDNGRLWVRQASYTLEHFIEEIMTPRSRMATASCSASVAACCEECSGGCSGWSLMPLLGG